eukprot:456182-Pelagomonas_calceolata.AAC.1
MELVHAQTAVQQVESSSLRPLMPYCQSTRGMHNAPTKVTVPFHVVSNKHTCNALSSMYPMLMPHVESQVLLQVLMVFPPLHMHVRKGRAAASESHLPSLALQSLSLQASMAAACAGEEARMTHGSKTQQPKLHQLLVEGRPA